METSERRLRIEVLRFFVRYQRAPTPADLATLLDAAHSEIQAGLRNLAAQHAVTLVPGSAYIWMANPFSALPTNFKVKADGKEWWGNCIWDALGILAALDSDGTVSTSCPDCMQPLNVEVINGTVDDADLLVHYAVPAKHWWDEIGYT